MTHSKMAYAVCVFGFAVMLHAADSDLRVELVAPEGWSDETIALPPGFAPTMAFKGTEEVRFAPGMFKRDRADFFSYALVFILPDQKTPDQKTLEVELLKYYRGLAVAVSKSHKREVDPSMFTLKLTAVPESSDRWTGELHWIEPFVTGAAHTLRFELQAGHVPDVQAAYLKMAASPQPESHAVWTDLRKILKSAQWHAPAKAGS